MSPGRIREAIGEVRASHNVPFVISMLIGAASLMVLLALSLQGPPFWALFGVAVTLFVAALIITFYAVFVSPELLRSERSTTFARTVETLGNDQISDSDKILIARSLERYLAPPSEKRPPGPHDAGEDDE